MLCSSSGQLGGQRRARPQVRFRALLLQERVAALPVACSCSTLQVHAVCPQVQERPEYPVHCQAPWRIKLGSSRSRQRCWGRRLQHGPLGRNARRSTALMESTMRPP